ncbi:uncharacterized protein LOC143910280 [Arctopsyche grandis]|uniref:uncharacterized protein LOC143910280 n=1 Tax=Arctopsyche grandis TaxID=121162 RepID=UPI00406D72BC
MLKNRLNDKWESILEDCMTDHGFTTFRLTINRKTDVKCSGVLLSVTVEGRKDRDFKIGFLIMKTLGDSEDDTKRDKIDQMFLTEAIVYNEVIKKFESMQADLATSDKFLFPLCYKSTDEYVLMEDLAMKNFALKDRVEILDFNHMYLALIELGRYHAFSIALKQRDEVAFNNLATKLDKGFFNYPKRDSLSFNDAINKCIDTLENENLKIKLKKASDGAIDRIEELLKRDNKQAVICHGDLTAQNTFFTYDENGEPSAMVMLDYQLSIASSPITDVLCLLFTSGTSEAIQQYETMLDIYYDSLKLFLKKFQCLADESYRKSDLKKDSVDYFPYVLAQSMLTIFEMYGKDENSKVFKEKINMLVENLSNLNLM